MTRIANNHGGTRPGAGRPRGSKSFRARAIAAESNGATDRIDYAVSRALVEAIKAKKSELDYQIKLGNYVEREAVRRACATGMARFAQAMRSMQDQMEKDLALAPDVVEAIGEYVDAALDQLAAAGFALYVK